MTAPRTTDAPAATGLAAGPVLEVRDLRVTYRSTPPVRALDGVTLALAAGECLGILGESGSGKSTLARALLGLVSEADIEGEIRFEGADVTRLGEAAWRPIRWKRIAMSFQSSTALNPVLRIGDQMADPLVAHLGLDRRSAKVRAAQLLAEVGLDASAADRYPNELSGGQQRLVLIAIALSCDPEVLLLDEPTGGLDTVTRGRVLSLLQKLRGHRTIVLISHDVEAVAALADRVAVLYRGWVAEEGPAEVVLDDASHPYSWALLNARPTLASVKDLRGIRGDAPDPTEVAPGCPFVGRCTQAVPDCQTVRPPLAEGRAGGDRRVSCLRGGLVTLIEARGLRKTYVSSGRLRRRPHLAVDDVSLDVREGEVVGLVGPTASGKSTIAKLLLRLLDADGGEIEFEGRDFLAAHGDDLRSARRRIQILFQNPYEALSPRLAVAQAVREPLDAQGIGDGATRDRMVREALAAVRLPPDAFLRRHPHELSGGQLQRVALARALVLEPKLLVADEPVAHLDPSEQAKMLQLLKTAQVERGMAMLLIAHELAIVLRVADRVVVVDGGRVVERGTPTQLFVSPQHPVTRSLLSGAGRDDLVARMLAGADAGGRHGPPEHDGDTGSIRRAGARATTANGDRHRRSDEGSRA